MAPNKKARVRKKYSATESAPKPNDSLGERHDLRKIPRRKIRKKKLDQWPKLIIVVATCLVFCTSALMAMNYATTEGDSGLVKYIVAATGVFMHLQVKHYFKSRGGDDGKDKRQGRLQSYFGLLEKVAELYRRITRAGKL